MRRWLRSGRASAFLLTSALSPQREGFTGSCGGGREEGREGRGEALADGPDWTGVPSAPPTFSCSPPQLARAYTVAVKFLPVYIKGERILLRSEVFTVEIIYLVLQTRGRVDLFI